VCVCVKQSTLLHTPTDLNLQQHNSGNMFRNLAVYVRIDPAEKWHFESGVFEIVKWRTVLLRVALMESRAMT